MDRNKIIIIVSVSILGVIFIGSAVYNALQQSHLKKFEKYNGVYYWANEGTVLEGEIIGPDVFKVSFSPEISADNLFLHFLTSHRTTMMTLDEFKTFLNGDTVREATLNETVNAELFQEKQDEEDSPDYVSIKDTIVKVGDLADDVFEVFTKGMSIKEPSVLRDHETNEILSVSHTYIHNGIEYRLNFGRMESFSYDYCYDCPYRLRGIHVYPNKSLTFNEYIQKYWVETNR
jgi:hypothetical protein